jgi:hypothetical protein
VFRLTGPTLPGARESITGSRDRCDHETYVATSLSFVADCPLFSHDSVLSLPPPVLVAMGTPFAAPSLATAYLRVMFIALAHGSLQLPERRGSCAHGLSLGGRMVG